MPCAEGELCLVQASSPDGRDVHGDMWREASRNLWQRGWRPVSYTHLTLPTKA